MIVAIVVVILVGGLSKEKLELIRLLILIKDEK